MQFPSANLDFYLFCEGYANMNNSDNKSVYDTQVTVKACRPRVFVFLFHRFQKYSTHSETIP